MRMHFDGIGALPNMDIDLDGITVIAGQNSTGKSTVLKTIYCMLEPSMDFAMKRDQEAMKTLEPLLRSSFLNNVPGMFRFDVTLLDTYISDLENKRLSASERDVLNSVKALRSGSMNDTLHSYLVGWCIESEFGRIDQFRSIGRGADAFVRLSHNGIDRRFTATERDVRWDGPYTDLPSVIYYDTPFILDEPPAQSPHPTHRGRLSTMIREDRDSSILDKIISDRRLESFERMIEDIVPGRISFDSKSHSIQYIENGFEPLEVKNLAAGMKVFSIIRLLIEVGRINQDTLIILDEPEIHLHPAWQVTLARTLVALRRGVGCKLLLTTHSPLLLRAIQAYSEIEGEVTRYYLMQRNGSGSIQCIDMYNNPERAYDSMADAYDRVDDLYYMDDRHGLES